MRAEAELTIEQARAIMERAKAMGRAAHEAGQYERRDAHFNEHDRIALAYPDAMKIRPCAR